MDEWEEGPVGLAASDSGGGQSRGRQQRRPDSNNWRRPNQQSNNWGSNSNASFNDDVTFEVPTRFVGRIIGKGGVKINSLQYDSGARIQVLKEYNGDNTIIKLNGSADQIEKAKQLISELTVDRN